MPNTRPPRAICVEIVLNRMQAGAALAALLLCLLPVCVDSDSVSLNTYYPSPYGIYTTLTTTDKTILAKDSGSVIIGPGGANDDNYKINIYGKLRTTSDSILAASGGTVDVSGIAVFRGALDMSGYRITNSTYPAGGSDAATKKFVEDHINQKVAALP